MRQVFNAPNIILIALLAEFVSIAQRHIHEFDVKGDSISSRPKAEIKKSQVRRIVHSSQMMYNLKYRLAMAFDYSWEGKKQTPYVLNKQFVSGYMQMMQKALGLTEGNLAMISQAEVSDFSCWFVTSSQPSSQQCHFSSFVPDWNELWQIIYFGDN